MYHNWHKLHFYKKKSKIAKCLFDICNTEMAQSLSSLQKSEFLSWLFNSSIIFGAKIEISGTKWVEKTAIYIYFFYFWLKKRQVWAKKLEKNKKIQKT